MTQVRRVLARHPAYAASIVGRNPLGGGGNFQLQASLLGPDLDTLYEYSQRIVEKAKQTPSLVDAKSDYSDASPEVQVAVDRSRAADLGVRMATIGNTLRLMVAGDDEITTYREAGEQYPVTVRVLESQRRDINMVGKLTVTSASGQPVRIDNIARLERGFGPTRISRSNRQYLDQHQRRHRPRPRARRIVRRSSPHHHRGQAAAGLHLSDAGADAEPRRDHGQPDAGDRAREHLRLHGARRPVRELRPAAGHHDGAAALDPVRAVHDLGDRPDAEPVERARDSAPVRHREEELDSPGGLHQRPAGAGSAAATKRSWTRAARGCARS